jgi:predicted RNA binding protein YcfA (HicA-like mRNA interferase family)
VLASCEGISLENGARCAYICASAVNFMETSRSKIVMRLEREGWINRGGGNHDVYTNPARPGVIVSVPRHRTLSPGVARKIAKLAGWTTQER